MRRLPLLAPLTLVALITTGAASGLVACGGTVTIADGATTSTTSTSTSSTSGISSGSCEAGSGTFAFELTTPDGTPVGCAVASGTNNAAKLQARLVSSDGYNMQFDGCSPAADCSTPAITKVHSSELFSAPVGIYVEIEALTEWNGPAGCGHKLLIRNLSSWDGSPNPFDSSGRVLLAGVDGTAYTTETTPFSASPMQLCGYDGFDQVSPTDSILFQSQDTQGSIVVEPGAAMQWPQPDGSFLQMRNLRSGPTVGYAWSAIPALLD
jgi:hypothetical protein